LGKIRTVQKFNGGDNSTNSKQKPRQKGHPHPWRDGTQLG
jgi:hypothetical protein